MQLQSCSSCRWDSHFYSYMLTIYVRLYWLWDLIVFYSLVSKGYIHKVSVQLLPKYFSRDCSTHSVSCSKRKKQDEKNIKTKQQLKTETKKSFLFEKWKQGISKHCCRYQSNWLIINFAVAAVAQLSLPRRFSVTALLLLCHSTVAPL